MRFGKYEYRIIKEKHWYIELLKNTKKYLPRYFYLHNVLEIGCLNGEGTKILSKYFNVLVRIYTIDIFNINYDKMKDDRNYKLSEQYKKSTESNQCYKYLKNISGLDNVTTILGDSNKIKFNKSLFLLIIDGGHSTKVFKKDFEKYFKLVCSKGVIIIDDYNINLSNIKKCTDELVKIYESKIKLIKNFDRYLMIIKK